MHRNGRKNTLKKELMEISFQIYLVEVNNWNTKTISEICSELT